MVGFRFSGLSGWVCVGAGWSGCNRSVPDLRGRGGGAPDRFHRSKGVSEVDGEQALRAVEAVEVAVGVGEVGDLVGEVGAGGLHPGALGGE